MKGVQPLFGFRGMCWWFYGGSVRVFGEFKAEIYDIEYKLRWYFDERSFEGFLIRGQKILNLGSLR